jgi:NADH dehydrogenase
VPIVGDVPAIRPSKAQRRRLPAEREAVDAAAAEDAG